MPYTAHGIYYPASGDHVRIWEHMQAAADSVESAISALGASTPFNPTLTNTVYGTGAIKDGWYTVLGKFCLWGFRLEFGAAGSPSFSNTIQIGLPVPAYVGSGGNQLQGTVGTYTLRDDSAAVHHGGPIGIWDSSGTTASFNGAWDGAQHRTRVGGGGGTLPFTLGNSDVLSGTGLYLIA